MSSVGEIVAKVSLGGMDQVQKELKAFSNAMKQVGKEASKIGDNLKKAGDSMSGLGESMAPVSAGFLALGGTAVLASENIAGAVNDFQTKLGATGADLAKYESVMQEVAKTGVGSFDEISNSIVSISQSMKGLSDTELATVTEEAMQLANVMGTDVSEVAKVSGQLMKQFGTTGLESLDLIAKGFQNGMDYAGDYADTLNEYSVYFSSLGFSAEDMFNVLAEGAEKGAFNLNKVGDAVKEFGIRSKDGSDASKEAFEALGFNADKLSSTFAQGGDGAKTAYAEVVNALVGVDDQVKRNEIGVALFGTQYEDMEKDVIASTGTIVDHMENVEGASMEVAQNNKTFAQEMQGAWNEIQLAIEPVGKILQDFVLQVMPPLIQGVEDVSKAFTELSPTMQKVGIGFGAFITILPALLIGIGGAVSLFGSFINGMVAVGKVIGIIRKSLKGLKTAFNAIKTAFTVLRTLFLANPFTLIVTGIVVVAVLIYKYWDEIVAFTKDTWQKLSDWFAPYWENFKTMVSNVVQAVVDAWSGFADGFMKVFDSVASVVATVWEGIKTAFLIYVGLILTIIAPIYNKFASIFNAIVGVVQVVWGKIKTGIILLAEGISTVLGKVKATFTIVWNFIYSNIISPVIAKIKSIVSTIWSFASSVLEKVKSIFKAVWDAIYNNVISPVINKVKNTIDGIRDRVKTVSDSVKSKLSDGFNSAKDKVVSAVKTITDKIGGIWDKAKGVAGDIKDAFSNIFKGIKVPSFSLGGWKPSDLPKLPKMSVQWNAQGGILDSATFIGAGEAGAEAIVPLSNQRKMAPFAKAISRFMPEGSNGGSGDTTINISSLVVREEADVEKIAQTLNKLQQRKERARGGLSFA